MTKTVEYPCWGVGCDSTLEFIPSDEIVDSIPNLLVSEYIDALHDTRLLRIYFCSEECRESYLDNPAHLVVDDDA